MIFRKFFLAFRLLTLLILVPGAIFGQQLPMDYLSAMEARNIGPAGMSGRVTAIDVVEDAPHIMYVGTASGGLWKSESGGTSWEPIFEEERVASIGALAIYQKNPDIIWAGTGEGNPRNSQTSGAGIYRSLDGGHSWECMGLEATRNIHRVIIHPDNPNIVYAGVQGSAWGPHPERGVYRTIDGGKSWDKILYRNDSTGVADLVMDPRNPNKLIVAMWEFRRWPWFFKSGGEGSGLFVTYDGGDSWEQRTEEDGLPKGELGRIGLAIAHSNPKVVYALVEAKENALYRSNDGGFTFTKVGTGSGIGNRPFYYADIFVDTENENRIYSLHSIVTRSEDGGKSFETLLGYVGSAGVHPDHHAFWIHPEDHNFLINGNDGGMAISRDMGRTWRFVENLPVAQYYHINVDNEWPYNVYGGMQDNGSWRGPAYVWRRGGILNTYFDELSFGDGFDVVPDPQNSRYGYSMSQEGFVGRYDHATGDSRRIRPVHPEGIPLRFNWNAAIAQDPHDPATVYFGSQFLHKSTDQGENWTVISPDLTTNDSTKQQQGKSGGLTYDVTGAENFTSIVSIAPSPLDEEFIWVGTDDGNLQLTRDGGQTWTNLADRLPGLPAGSWIPQINASTYNAGEVFVVANNYRRNDWTPYLYHSDDYGATWVRLVDTDEVWGYCLSFVQDVETPNLMFLGTEFGLYVSINAGESWQKWTHGYPTVSTMDLVIHPREQDLGIGTFGRSAFVLDDIRPLRAMAQDPGLTERPLAAFPQPTAVMARWGQPAGGRFSADGVFKGDNRRPGAMISVWAWPQEADTTAEAPELPDHIAGGDTMSIEIFAEDGRHIRTLYEVPDSGLNRIYWGMEERGVPYPSRRGGPEGRYEPGGIDVLPGTYQLRFHYAGFQDSTELTVVMDPRLPMDREALAAYRPLYGRYSAMYQALHDAGKQLQQARTSLKLVQDLLPEDPEAEEMVALKDSAKAMSKQLNELEERIFGPAESKGYVDDSQTMISQVGRVRGYVQPDVVPPSGTAEIVLSEVEAKLDAFLEEFNAFFAEDWTAFQEQVEAATLSPFQELSPVRRGED